MICVKQLKKTFKLSKRQQQANGDGRTEKHAVDGIDFTVNNNELFGLLGPNGAGKTTTLRCLSTLIAPTSGQIIVDQLDTVNDAAAVRKKLAFLTSELKLDPHFTPDYTMLFFGRLHDMTPELIANRTHILFERFGITGFAHTKIKDLSTGMKQKLSIAVSLIHDPAVIIFDEPTNGLDIVTAKSVTDYLLELKSMGKTIIVSTHQMHVAAKLCDRIAILLRGKIECVGTLSEIMTVTETHSLEDAFFKLYNRVKGGGYHA